MEEYRSSREQPVILLFSQEASLRWLDSGMYKMGLSLQELQQLGGWSSFKY